MEASEAFEGAVPGRLPGVCWQLMNKFQSTQASMFGNTLDSTASGWGRQRGGVAAAHQQLQVCGLR